MSIVQETLRDFVNESGKTIYSLANETGIERSYLTKILSSKRNLSYDNFVTIVDAVCDDYQRNEITSKYIWDTFGKEKFDYYCENLSSSIYCDFEKKTTIKEINEDFVAFDSKLSLLNFAEFLVSDENPTNILYTNFPTKTLLKLTKEKKNCDFRCIISTDSKDRATSIFDLIKLNMRYCVSFVDKNNENMKPKNSFYPYIITTDSCVLFANSKMDRGYFVRNKDLAKLYADDFYARCSRMKVATEIYDDILNVKEIIKKNLFNKKIHRVITNNFCAVAFMTRSEFEELAREDLPERGYLINTTYEYYRTFFESIDTHKFIISYDGLADFCNTGIIHEMPSAYSRPLSIETRYNILKRVAQFIKNEPDKFTLNFFRNSKLEKIEINLDIESTVDHNTENSQLVVMSEDKTLSNNFPGNYFFISTENQSNTDFNRFFDMLLISDHLMTKKESLAALEDRILRLKYIIDDIDSAVE